MKKLLIVLPVLLLAIVLLLVLSIGLSTPRTWLYQQGIQFANNNTDWRISSQGLQSKHLGHIGIDKLSVVYKPNNAELISADAVQLDLAWKQLLSKKLLVKEVSAQRLWINGLQSAWPATKEKQPKPKKTMDEIAEEINQWVDQVATLTPEAMPPVVIEKLQIKKLSSEPKIPELSEKLLVNARIGGKVDLQAYQANLDINIDAKYADQQLPVQNLVLNLQHENQQAHLKLDAKSISKELLRLLSSLNFEYPADLQLYAHTAVKPNRIIIKTLGLDYGKGELIADAELLNATLTGQLQVKNLPLAFIPIELQKPIDDFELQGLNASLDFDTQLNKLNKAFVKGNMDAIGQLENKTFTVKSHLHYQEELVILDQLNIAWATANISGKGEINLAEQQLAIDLLKTHFPLAYLSDFEVVSPHPALDLSSGYVNLNNTKINGTFTKPIIKTDLQAKANVDTKDLSITGKLFTDLNKISLTPLAIKRKKTTLNAQGDIYLNNEKIDLKLNMAQFDSRDFPTLLKDYLQKDYVLADIDLTLAGQWDNPLASIHLDSKGQYAKTDFTAKLQGQHDTKTLLIPELLLNIIDKKNVLKKLKLKVNAEVQGIGLKGLNADTFNGLVNIDISQADLEILKSLKQTNLYNSISQGLESLNEYYRFKELGKLNGNLSIGLNDKQLSTRGNLALKQMFTAATNGKLVRPLNADLKWNAPNEQLTAKANISGLDITDKAFLNIDSQLKLSEIRQGLMTQLRGGNFELKTINAQLKGHVDLILAGLFLNKDVQKLDGLINFDTKISGNLKKPNINGFLKTVNTAYSDKFIGIDAKKIDLQLNLNNQLATIKQGLVEFDDAGSVKLSGQADWQKQELDLQAIFNEANLINQSGLQGQISGNVKVAGNVGLPNISGDIDINKLNIFLDQLQVSSIDHIKVTKVKSLDKANKIKETTKPFAKLDIKVRANNNLYVRGYGMEAELGGNIGLKGLSNNLQTVGNFNLVRGNFKWLDQRFILDQMNITMVNSALSLLLNGEAETDDYIYKVHLAGSLEDLDFKLNSVPSLPQDEILARIMFGKPVQQMTALQGLQLAAAINSLQNGGVGVLNTPREKMGLDSLSVDQETSDEGDSSLSFGFGKYLTKKTYLQVKRVDDKQNPWKAKVEHQLNKRISAEAYTGGKSGLGGVKLNWKKNY